jgi:predicted 3-demethylubiquinone-9 3-methyltransferase (glyoxalase superfamily)
MFDGDAKQAMLLYAGLFSDSEIIESTEYVLLGKERQVSIWQVFVKWPNL